MAGRTVRFTLQRPLHRTRPCHRGFTRGSLLCCALILLRLLSDGRWALRRSQFYPSSSRFRQANSDRLLRRTRTMFPLPNVMDLFPDKFSGLSRRRFALARVLFGSFQGLSFWHMVFILLTNDGLKPTNDGFQAAFRSADLLVRSMRFESKTFAFSSSTRRFALSPRPARLMK